MSKLGILLDAETIQYEQRCAISNVNLLQDLFDQEIAAMAKTKTIMCTDYLQELSCALCCVSNALRRANQELMEAVEDEYEKRKASDQSE